jgi:hypothetical protein
MTRAAPTDDEQLLAMIHEADPLDDGDPLLGETDAMRVDGQRLLQRILASERTTPRSRWQRTRRQRLALSATSAGVAVAAAVTAVLVFTAGNTPSVAFAGWSAHPTVAAGGQVRGAESECQRNPKLASLSPTLADTRGPYTLLIYAENPGGECVTGPSMLSPRGEPVVAPLHGAALTTPVAGDAIKRIDNALVTAKASPPSAALSFNDGRVGAHVTAVTLVLADGSRVQATVANGWFAAWWPGDQAAQAAEVTTTAGTAIQQLVPPPGYETSAAASATGTR